MTYTFVNISTVKFSINGRELFKTFIPFFVNNDSIKVISVYDSQTVLVPVTNVADFVVDGNTYTNATDLSNAIHTVIYSKNVEGSVNNEQIEINRLAIIDLNNDKSNINHNHDNRYYTQTQIDQIINGINVGSGGAVKGDVDGDVINFRNANDVLIFSIDAKSFMSQGTMLSFKNGVLTLKNEKGTVLSTTNIEAKESYYDRFKFVTGNEDDLSDLILTDAFQVVKTVGDLYFFVSDINNIETLSGTRIYLNDLDLFIDLSAPDITTANFRAWAIAIGDESFVPGNLYRFGFWIKDPLTEAPEDGKTYGRKDKAWSIIPDAVDLTAYQLKSEKNTPNGYLGAGALGLLPIERHNIEGVVGASPVQTTPLNGNIFWYLNASGVLVRTTWAELVATLQATFDLRYRYLYDRLVKQLDVSGTYAFDLLSGETWRLTMVGNTSFSIGTKPPANFTKTVTAQMDGDFAPTWSAELSDFKTGSYVGTKLNTLVIEYVEGDMTKFQITQND